MASNPSSSLPLSGRTAIVTGASSGIGRAIASHLSSLGADVIIGYSSNPAPAEALASELTTSRAVPVKSDVSDPAAVQSLFDTAESAFGRPASILVASAGVLDAKYPTLADTSVEDWDKTFAVNTRGAFLCCREATKRLVRGGGGRIIVMSSSLVATFQPGYAAYTASKAAVEAMVKIIAKELKGTAITANCVAPGPVATDMFFAGKSEEVVKRSVEMNPMGRIGETDDIVPIVGFLCTDAAGWVNGQVIRVNGGSA
ncbi:short-chain type dehydrogenase/reductase-like protein [Carex littledalei]|uniref:Short-chain type dehydrogenase/reductase-like protein n=1 Tax=Carex littledalei TaxID=544730 RepID=A0A833RC16_9POAL|nr:short-chain type dehydrogenase/reductase-like protein [Carex littledalei]